MKEFAKEFYLSAAWRAAREYIFRRASGLCEACGGAGAVVHHKIYITPENINDSFVTLAEENLELLCRGCHAATHSSDLATEKELMFDELGNIVERIIKL